MNDIKLMIESSLPNTPIHVPFQTRLESYPSKVVTQLVLTTTATTHLGRLNVIFERCLTTETGVKLSSGVFLRTKRMEETKVSRHHLVVRQDPSQHPKGQSQSCARMLGVYVSDQKLAS
jgi:pSer/pThr/pTyr-binding forkhead associated (FHA) protein